MKTPIDLRTISLPIKPKYIDEETSEFAAWIIFGTHPDDTVVIYDPCDDRDIMIGVPRDKAENIIKIRRFFADCILDIINRK